MIGSSSFIVAKVGGSLYDMLDLGPCLARWMASLENSAVLLVPGGGKLVRWIQKAQGEFGFDDKTAHWIAMRALKRNAHFLEKRLALSGKHLKISQFANPRDWTGQAAILDCHQFLIQDEGTAGCLPHRWEVTSDSIAARAAYVGRAAELVLFKSVDLPGELTWDEAAQKNLVDAYFPCIAGAAKRMHPGLQIRAVNFRNSLSEAHAFPESC
jgi:aspartokinase-like uncharacterized kinase